MDFGTLKSRVEAIIGRSPADVCYEMVTSDINAELRLRLMEATTTLTEALEIALPTDFLGVSTLYRDVTPRQYLQATSAEGIQKYAQPSGTPIYYAIVDGTMLLDRPGDGQSIVLRYFAQLGALAADGDTNRVLTTHPNIFVYGALAHHAAVIRDEAALPIWAAAYRDAKKAARAADAKYRAGATPNQVTPRATA